MSDESSDVVGACWRVVRLVVRVLKVLRRAGMVSLRVVMRESIVVSSSGDAASEGSWEVRG